MNSYKVKEVKADGYVTLVKSDQSYESEVPLRSAKIMFESGFLSLDNPAKIYQSKH